MPRRPSLSTAASQAAKRLPPPPDGEGVRSTISRSYAGPDDRVYADERSTGRGPKSLTEIQNRRPPPCNFDSDDGRDVENGRRNTSVKRSSNDDSRAVLRGPSNSSVRDLSSGQAFTPRHFDGEVGVTRTPRNNVPRYSNESAPGRSPSQLEVGTDSDRQFRNHRDSVEIHRTALGSPSIRNKAAAESPQVQPHRRTELLEDDRRASRARSAERQLEVVTVEMDLDEPAELECIIWKFTEEGAIVHDLEDDVPKNWRIKRGDLLVSICGQAVKGLPRSQVAEIWDECQEGHTESRRWFELGLLPLATGRQEVISKRCADHLF